jgi:hypothetical protein
MRTHARARTHTLRHKSAHTCARVLQLLDDFWRGLPVDSAAHTNLDMAAVYALQQQHTNF